MKLTLFHRPKPKSFNYKPIYSNPEDEKKNKRDEKISLKDRFQQEKEKKFTSSTKKGLNITMYIIIILLMLYLIFFS